MGHDRGLTMIVLALASASVEIAAEDTRPVHLSLLRSLAWIALPCALRILLPSPKDPGKRPPLWVNVLIVAGGLLPIVLEPVFRTVWGSGNALELLLVFSLRNLGLGLAAAGAWRSCQRLAAIISLFLVLFASAMSNNEVVMAILVLYGCAGSAWLMHEYWSGMGPIMTRNDAVSNVEVFPGQAKRHFLTLLITGIGAVVLVSALAFIPRKAGWSLGEWVATSGGTGANDPYARGGIGDGDDETEGDNPESTGMTRSDIFLDSPLPSLYDMVSDMYGEPIKKIEQERVEALDPNDVKGRDLGRVPADNLRPNRQFPHARKSSPNASNAKTRDARSIFEISGSGPVHVRAAAYDVYDGSSWLEGPIAASTATPASRNGARKQFEINNANIDKKYSFTDHHEIKITAPEGSLIPSPPYMNKFRLGRLSDPTFFAWAQPGILRFGTRKTPPGIVLDSESQIPDPSKMKMMRFTAASINHLDRKDTTADRYKPLAEAWTFDTDQSWTRISTIIEKLRNEFDLDNSARPPDDCHDPLMWFLTESHKGPDHLFAGAAAMLLRSCGFTTRLVTGFYADPANRDQSTGYIPVTSGDIHTWLEIRANNSDWIILEPTPGYEHPTAPLSLIEKSSILLQGIWNWLLAHLIFTLITSSVLLATTIFYNRIIDAIRCLAIACWPETNCRNLTLRVVKVLEARAARGEKSRPANQTLARWLQSRSDIRGIPQLAEVVDWASYGAHLPPPFSEQAILKHCRVVLQDWKEGAWNESIGWRARAKRERS